MSKFLWRKFEAYGEIYDLSIPCSGDFSKYHDGMHFEKKQWSNWVSKFAADLKRILGKPVKKGIPNYMKSTAASRARAARR